MKLGQFYVFEVSALIENINFSLCISLLNINYSLMKFYNYI